MDLFFFGGGFEILFSLAFFAVLAVILVTAVRGLLQWNQNNHSPRLTVPAVVAAKRTATTHSHHNTGGAAHVQNLIDRIFVLLVKLDQERAHLPVFIKTDHHWNIFSLPDLFHTPILRNNLPGVLYARPLD